MNEETHVAHRFRRVVRLEGSCYASERGQSRGSFVRHGVGVDGDGARKRWSDSVAKEGKSSEGKSSTGKRSAVVVKGVDFCAGASEAERAGRRGGGG